MTDISDTAFDLLNNCKGLTLATQGKDGPLASFAPFIWYQDAVFIFISTLAPHTRNLQMDAHCSALLLEESENGNAQNSFARCRMSIATIAKFINRTEPVWAEAIAEFESRHGKTIHLLAELPDFYLVKLSVQKGSLIEGFGKTTHFELTHFTDGNPVSGR